MKKGMKKGKLVLKNNWQNKPQFIIEYLDTYAGRDNGGYERDRTGWFDIEIHPDFPIDILEYLLDEELEFETCYYKYQDKNDWTWDKKVADIKLSVQQNRDIKISQIIDNNINKIIE